MQPHRDATIATLAASQHGVVSLGQLRALGLSGGAVGKRVARGLLHRVHRGVFAVGHPGISSHGRWLAAVLACGAGALLSHHSAACLRGLVRGGRSMIDVTVPRRGVRARAGCRVHTTSSLTIDDESIVDGIPCTSVARTLVDFADVGNRREVERAIEQAEVQRAFGLGALDAALERAGPRPGVGVIRSILSDLAPPALTASELEECFLALCASAGLPRPMVNPRITAGGDSFQVDFLFADQRLVVETDGYEFHAHRASFERDRRRDQALQIAGYRVMRCTWRQVVREPGALAGTMEALLGHGTPNR